MIIIQELFDDIVFHYCLYGGVIWASKQITCEKLSPPRLPGSRVKKTQKNKNKNCGIRSKTLQKQDKAKQ